ncbi:NAD kinase [Bacteroidales bacterium OttesenSCG-928-I21]|nr:NAD kinase [Bacteroidales bacterium OttesenSCG-928-I21]
MNIAIYGRNFGNNFSGMAIQLFEELKRSNINVYINEKFYNFIKEKIYYTPQIKDVYEKTLPVDVKIDFLISVGGDGTFLESATIVKNSGIPILGVNTGRLGFLAYVSSHNIIPAIKQLFEGKYTIDKRMLLEVNAKNEFYGDINFCLNEFAVQKKSRLNMIKTKVYADSNYINTYWSDGLIVATPTGSTAYSLSCGGPIVVPHSNTILITPIANHNLTVRPLVISAQSEIKIVIDSNEDNVLVSLDYRTYNIKDVKEILIKKSNFYINFVNLFENNYFSTLREKLMWGLDLRN